MDHDGTKDEDKEHEQAVILVVGADTEYKTLVADALAEGCGAVQTEIRVIGERSTRVRVFCRRSTPEPIVIDTKPLSVQEDGDFVHTARTWVSLNSLKRMSSKLVFVVCVMTSSGPEDPIHKEPDFTNQQFTWLHLLAYIFRGHQLAIMILVKVEGVIAGRTIERETRDAIRRGGFASANVSFETLGDEGLREIVRSILGYSVDRGERSRSFNTMAPFRLKEVKVNDKDTDIYGPWGPERVILIGGTGSGYSQMLTLEKLNNACESSLVRPRVIGEGTSFLYGEGEGEGSGSSEDEMPGIEWSVCQRDGDWQKLKSEGIYTRIIYMVKRGRLDTLDKLNMQNLWQLLGEAILDNLTFVESDSGKQWMEDNTEFLRQSFKGLDSFLSYDFPPTQHIDGELNSQWKEYRLTMTELEHSLTRLTRRPTSGASSSSKSSGTAESKIEKVNAALTKDAMSFLQRLSESSRNGPDVDVGGRSFSRRWLPSNRYMSMA